VPTAPRRPCVQPGCPQLQPCPVHKPHTRVGARYVDRKGEPGRQVYKTAKWLRLRKRALDAHPLCVQCDARGVLTLGTVVDHIQPHQGDEQLAYDQSNLQVLCTRCHGEKSAYEMNTKRRSA
jgi:5-methylcytosine-specific restriction protein A